MALTRLRDICEPAESVLALLSPTAADPCSAPFRMACSSCPLLLATLATAVVNPSVLAVATCHP